MRLPDLPGFDYPLGMVRDFEFMHPESLDARDLRRAELGELGAWHVGRGKDDHPRMDDPYFADLPGELKRRIAREWENERARQKTQERWLRKMGYL